MAIQNRRGLKKDFDPAKMLPGEFAVSIDSETENQIVWMCFAPGVVKRIGTYEDFEKYLAENCKTAYEYAVDGGYTGTEDEFKAKMAQECADAIVASASGAVIAVSDSAEAKLKGLLVHGKSTQDGTPTPSAQVDIVSAGKYNEATGKYEVVVTVSDGNSENVQTVTIPLSDKLRSVPDGTGDIIHVDRATGTAWVERKIIEFVLDGSSDELWTLAGTNTSGKYRPDCYSYRNICKGYTDNAIPSNVYCNQFVAMSPDKNYLNNESIAIRYGGDIYIYEEAYSEKTLDEFRARLSANPITVIAELATPTTEELPEETVNQLLALTSYYPNTTITTDQGVTMEVEYVADTKNYIDNKFDELKTALLATGANV